MAGRDPGTFGELLRRLRTDAGLTQEELAEAAQLSPRSVSDLERGVNLTARRETARLLADALGLTGPARAEFEAVARGRTQAVGGAAVATRTLPRDIASFTGREPELRELVALAATAASVGVVGIHAIGGMAGIGKTAFAVHAAHQLASRFPDGQIFLPLHGHTPGQEPVDPADALASLLLTVGAAAAQIPPGVDARMALWRDRLAGRRLLLVLDDAADSEQVRPLLPGERGSLVLVTSRRRLSALDDATAISLDTLPPEQAAALLVRLAARPGLSPQDEVVGAIARLCGYLPLAVGMLARQLHHHPAWNPAELAAELASARDRLELMATENVTVTAAFNMSYESLTSGQQRVFRRLGLHPGADIDVYATAALDGIDLRAARRHLDALYGQYLLSEPSRGRYRLHDLIREHAHALAEQQDPASDRDSAVGRLLDYYQQAATVAGRLHAVRADRGPAAVVGDPIRLPEISTRDQAATWLAAEHANMLACIVFAAGSHLDRAVGLDAAISEYLFTAGHWDQALHAHQAALTAARLSGDRAGEAGCLTRLGASQKFQDEYDAAARTLTEAVSLCRDLGDRPGLADALTEFGDVRHLLGDEASAIETLTEATALYHELGDPQGEARALTYLGGIQVGRSAYQAALDTLTQALDLSREVGDRRAQAHALNYVGAAQYLTGSYAAAARSVAEVITLYRDLGNKFGEGHALINRASILLATCDYPNAAEALTAALEIYRSLGDRLGQGNVLTHFGEMYTATGDQAQAVDHLNRALAIYLEIGGRRGQGNVYQLLGNVHRQTGEYASATSVLNQALAIFRESGIRLGEADTLTVLGDVQRRTGKFAEASVALDQALAIYRDISDRRGQAEALNQIGALLLATGRDTEALARHTEAMEVAREISSQLDEANALTGMGRCLAQAGDTHHARICIRQALDIYQQIASPQADEVVVLLASI